MQSQFFGIRGPFREIYFTQAGPSGEKNIFFSTFANFSVVDNSWSGNETLRVGTFPELTNINNSSYIKTPPRPLINQRPESCVSCSTRRSLEARCDCQQVREALRCQVPPAANYRTRPLWLGDTQTSLDLRSVARRRHYPASSRSLPYPGPFKVST